jgi:hypothetical protein
MAQRSLTDPCDVAQVAFRFGTAKVVEWYDTKYRNEIGVAMRKQYVVVDALAVDMPCELRSVT